MPARPAPRHTLLLIAALVSLWGCSTTPPSTAGNRQPPAVLQESGTTIGAVLDHAGPDAAAWHGHTWVLTTPWMEGRAPGSSGAGFAVGYLVDAMARAGLTPAFGDGTRWRQVFAVPGEHSPPLRTANIAGVLPGHGNLADQWIVLGAHWDHLGDRGEGSRAQGDEQHDLHLGADDNASGVAAILVLADRLTATLPTSLAARRSIAFVLFGAEESGLHGSKAFVEAAPMPIESIVAMLNFDMIGRLEDGPLEVLGTGTATEFDAILAAAVAETSLTLEKTPGGPGPSDHTNFYHAAIPVLMFHTGLTSEYHTPDDLPETLDVAGAMQVIDLTEVITQRLAWAPSRLTFQKNTVGVQSGRSRTGAAVTLGVMPAYGAKIESGVQIDGTVGGSPAEEAGLDRGDILLTWDGEAIDGARGLGEALRRHAPGDVITLTIDRQGTAVTVQVTLRARPAPPQ
jgi:hypothetical protein